MIRTFDIQTTSGFEKVRCPGSWSDVSCRLFLKIIKEWKYDASIESLVKLFAILTGKNFNSLLNSTDETLEEKLVRYVSFVYAPGFKFDELPVPKFMSVGGVDIEIPKSLGKLTLGQNLQIRKRTAEVQDLRELIVHACAVYLQPLIDKAPFDMDRVTVIEEQLMDESILKVYPIGFFLLRRRSNYGSGLSPLFHRLKQMLTMRYTLRKLELKSFNLTMTLVSLLNMLSVSHLTLI